MVAQWQRIQQEAAPCFDPIDAWQRQAGGLRQYLKGWGANIGRANRDAKADILAQISALDLEADTTNLDEDGWALRYFLEDQLAHLARVEEAYWQHRSRINWLL